MLRNNAQGGSLIVEAMLAISILSLFAVSSLSLVWSARTLAPVLYQKSSALAGVDIESASANTTGFTKSWYGDDTSQISFASSTDISTTASDYQNAIGRSSCTPTFSSILLASTSSTSSSPSSTPKYIIHEPQAFLGTNVFPTDIVVHNSFVYLTVDSTVQADPDLYIIDDTLGIVATSTGATRIVSALDTGPGLGALTVAGHYVYVANTSTTGQLQVIDIGDRSKPIITSKLKLPLPVATSTPSHGTAIAYSENVVYLGTDKWDGAEFSAIDITNPLSPQIIGSYEIGSTVEHITVRSGIVYVATAGSLELLALDVHDPSHILMKNSFTPAGWQIEEGRQTVFHHDLLWYARYGGGFNTSGYRELYRDPLGSLNDGLSPTSTHVSGGIYGMAVSDPYVFDITRFASGTLDVWLNDLSAKVTSIPLGVLPVALSCDGKDMFIATQSARGFVRIKFLPQ